MNVKVAGSLVKMQEAIFINKLQNIVVSELECVIYTVQKDEQDHTQKNGNHLQWFHHLAVVPYSFLCASLKYLQIIFLLYY